MLSTRLSIGFGVRFPKLLSAATRVVGVLCAPGKQWPHTPSEKAGNPGKLLFYNVEPSVVAKHCSIDFFRRQEVRQEVRREVRVNTPSRGRERERERERERGSEHERERERQLGREREREPASARDRDWKLSCRIWAVGASEDSGSLSGA